MNFFKSFLLETLKFRTTIAHSWVDSSNRKYALVSGECVCARSNDYCVHKLCYCGCVTVSRKTCSESARAFRFRKHLSSLCKHNGPSSYLLLRNVHAICVVKRLDRKIPNKFVCVCIQVISLQIAHEESWRTQICAVQSSKSGSHEKNEWEKVKKFCSILQNQHNHYETGTCPDTRRYEAFYALLMYNLCQSKLWARISSNFRVAVLSVFAQTNDRKHNFERFMLSYVRTRGVCLLVLIVRNERIFPLNIHIMASTIKIRCLIFFAQQQ